MSNTDESNAIEYEAAFPRPKIELTHPWRCDVSYYGSDNQIYLITEMFKKKEVWYAKVRLTIHNKFNDTVKYKILELLVREYKPTENELIEYLTFQWDSARIYILATKPLNGKVYIKHEDAEPLELSAKEDTEMKERIAAEFVEGDKKADKVIDKLTYITVILFFIIVFFLVQTIFSCTADMMEDNSDPYANTEYEGLDEQERNFKFFDNLTTRGTDEWQWWHDTYVDPD